MKKYHFYQRYILTSLSIKCSGNRVLLNMSQQFDIRNKRQKRVVDVVSFVHQSANKSNFVRTRSKAEEVSK